MSRTLSLVDHLLNRARNYCTQGRDADAVRVLRRLRRFPDLPSAAAEEVQAELAELRMRQGKYLQARRHLTAALRLGPKNPRYHRLMAAAVASDERCDPRRAVELYRRALEWEPAQPTCLAGLGKLLLDLGHNEEGLRNLRKAADLDKDNPEVLGKLAEGLSLANRADEARELLKAARFRHPRDVRFGQLWNDFQFRQARREQEIARHRNTARRNDDGPVLLPFVRAGAASTPANQARKVIRHDPPAPLPPPHVPRPVRLSDQRHVQ